MRNFVRVHPRVRPGAISIIVPTLTEREDHLKRCMEAYEATTSTEYELLIVRDRPSCGVAWNVGAAKALGDYLHFTADDLEPHEGWDVAALETLRDGYLPAPVVYRLEPRSYEAHQLDSPELRHNPPIVGLDLKVETSGGHWDRQPVDGEVTLNTCVVPFCRRRDWEANIGPSLECHYYTDNYFSDQARRAGLQFAIRTGYAFTHHWAKEGRGDEQARMAVDRELYKVTRKVSA